MCLLKVILAWTFALLKLVTIVLCKLELQEGVGF